MFYSLNYIEIAFSEFYGNIRCKLFWRFLHSLLITFVYLKNSVTLQFKFFRKAMNNDLNVTYI